MFILKQICFFHCDFTDGWKRTILSYSCFYVPAVISLSSSQTRDHFTRVIFTSSTSGIQSKLFMALTAPVCHPDSITKERGRERKHIAFTFAHKGAAAREWQQGRCFSLFLSDSLGLSGEYRQRSAASSWLLHLQPFLFQIFSLPWDLTEPQLEGTFPFFYFYHFDLIIMPFIVPGSRLVSCFQWG